jgi:YHS domain-containing protein
MAIDPICGMTMDERTAISAERDGEKFYFVTKAAAGSFWPAKLAPSPTSTIRLSSSS